MPWLPGRWRRWKTAARSAESGCSGGAVCQPLQPFAVRVVVPEWSSAPPCSRSTRAPARRGWPTAHQVRRRLRGRPAGRHRQPPGRPAGEPVAGQRRPVSHGRRTVLTAVPPAGNRPPDGPALRLVKSTEPVTRQFRPGQRAPPAAPAVAPRGSTISRRRMIRPASGPCRQAAPGPPALVPPRLGRARRGRARRAAIATRGPGLARGSPGRRRRRGSPCGSAP
jgi:hypothetical protein